MSVGALVAFLPSGLVLAWIGGVVVDIFLQTGKPWAVGLIPVCLWFFSPLVGLRYPQLELALNARLLGGREPPAHDAKRLDVLWGRVCFHAGVRANEFSLLVTRQESVNALAAGRRTIAVTEGGLKLPDRELEAVLAHELGRLMNRHAVPLALAVWWTRPFDGFTRVVDAFSRGEAFSDRVARLGLGFVVTVIGIPAAIALNAFCFLLRCAEYEADANAKRWGYADELANVLAAHGAHEVVAIYERIGWIPVNVTTHPPTPARLARLAR